LIFARPSVAEFPFGYLRKRRFRNNLQRDGAISWQLRLLQLLCFLDSFEGDRAAVDGDAATLKGSLFALLIHYTWQ